MSYLLRSVNFRRCLTQLVAVNGRQQCAGENVARQLYISKRMNSGELHRVKKNIDRYIRKLDADARRNGRINRRELDDLLEEIKTTREATSTQSLLIIRCCGSLLSGESPESRTKLVQEVWNVFDKLGIPLDISHYNALLRVYLENEHAFSPSEMLAEIERRGLEPNRVTYQRLITSYCQSGDIDGATRILEFMREKEMPVNENVFNALILGHSQCNDMKSAEGILGVMKQAGLEPTAETYTILICGYIKQGDINKMYSVMEECEKQDIYFIDKDYLQIAYVLALNKQKDHVDEILKKIRKSSGYNQEATNYIHRLVVAGHDEVAYEVLKTMVRPTRIDGSVAPVGNFFVALLVKQNRPFEEIQKYCDAMIKENLNSKAYLIALEVAVRQGQHEMALKLFHLVKEQGHKVKQHYFWPILQTRGKRGDIRGMREALSIMSKEFNLTPDADTLRDYVIPHMLRSGFDATDIVMQLKADGALVGTITSSLVINFLQQYKLKEAADLAGSYRAYYSPYVVRRYLVNALLETQDIESFVTLLKHMCVGIQWRAAARAAPEDETEEGAGEEEAIPDHSDFICVVTLDVLKQLKGRPERVPLIHTMLQGYVSAGLSLKNSNAQQIQNALLGSMTMEISTALERLTSAAPGQIEMKYTGGRATYAAAADQATLERLLEEMDARGEPTYALRKQLFLLYCRNKELEKALKVKEGLESEDFVFTSGMLAQLIDTYVDKEKVDETIELYDKLREKDPDFLLDITKTLRFACMLVRHERYDKAEQLLNKNSASERKNEEVTFSDGVWAWRILNVFAEKGDVDNVKKFLNLMLTNSYAEVSNVLFGPLIKAHLVRDDIRGALDAFEDCAQKYRVTPYKSELTIKLIQSEDPQALQRLTDISTHIHGEVNSLYDLMLNFLECGRVRQAKKILETPGLKLRQDRLYNASIKYQNEGATEHLENLIEVTKDLPMLDRAELYYNLLTAYNKADNPDKALSLWTEMQDEDVQPSDEFLILLADLLRRHDKHVPFTVPDSVTARESRDSPGRHGQQTQELRRLVLQEKIDEALQLKSKSKSGKFTVFDLSLLVESLLKKDRYEEAKSIIMEMIKTGQAPVKRIVNFFVIRAMVVGDYDALLMLDQYLPRDLKQSSKLNNRICQAYANRGKLSEYFDKLEKDIDAINSPEEYEQHMKLFPRGGIISSLIRNPNYLPTVERIVNKCLQKNSKVVSPANMLWVYHMMEKNFEKANEIWRNYMQSAEGQVAFKPIVSRALDETDEDLLNKLLETLKKRQDIFPAALGYVYGSLITVYLKQNNIEKAMDTLENAMSDVTINDIRKTALETLKIAAEAKSIPFKYRIPPRKTGKNEEYSSSDED